MAKMIALVLVISVLLCSTIAHATRPLPLGTRTQHHHVIDVDREPEELTTTENCNGMNEEECLQRRTLAAHTDYIYTQHGRP